MTMGTKVHYKYNLGNMQKKIHEDLERQGSALQDPIDSVGHALLAYWWERFEQSEQKLVHLEGQVANDTAVLQSTQPIDFLELQKA